MKTTYKISVAVYCLLSIVNCQLFSQTGPPIQWQNNIGGSDDDHLYSMQQTADGGYILGGHSRSNISGDKTENCIGYWDYWIVKTDSVGNIQWQNTIGGNDWDVLNSIQQTTDGGYILGGYSYSNISGDKTENSNGYQDYWIVKTDFLGNIEWQNSIGGSNGDCLFSIQQTADGGYILGGYSYSNASGDKTENNWDTIMYSPDYWIVKIDDVGNIQWQNTIGGSGPDWLTSIQQTTDGGYIVGGYSESNITGDKTENSNGFNDMWILKIDAVGNIQWQNTIGGNSNDQPCSIQQTPDGGYILGGQSISNISGDKTEDSWNNTYDYWIVKTDLTGNIQWQNTIGGRLGDFLFSIQQCTDGGYILGGYSYSNISGDKTENCWSNLYDYWIVKTDSTGNIQWQNNIGGFWGEMLFSVQQTADGGYILGGNSTSPISGDKTENCYGYCDIWIVKIAPVIGTGISPISDPLKAEGVAIFPNPAVNNFTLTFPHTINNGVIEISDVMGEKIFEENVFNVSQKEIHLKNIDAGIYFLKARVGEKEYAEKLIVQ